MKKTLLTLMLILLIATPLLALSSVEDLASSKYLTGSGTWIDVGSEIPMKKDTQLTILADCTVNDASALSFRVLGKHTYGGTDEFSIANDLTMSSSDQLTASSFALSSVADQDIAFVLDTYGAPYAQIQGNSTYSGTAGMVTLKYIKKQGDE